MNSSSKDNLISEISHRHTPDSVREDAYRELQSKHNISKEEAKKLADEKHGDYWG